MEDKILAALLVLVFLMAAIFAISIIWEGTHKTNPCCTIIFPLATSTSIEPESLANAAVILAEKLTPDVSSARFEGKNASSMKLMAASTLFDASYINDSDKPVTIDRIIFTSSVYAATH